MSTSFCQFFVRMSTQNNLHRVFKIPHSACTLCMGGRSLSTAMATHKKSSYAWHKAQMPLYRLPSDVCDKLVTSPSAQIPVMGLSRTCRGRHGEVGIVEFGHKRAATSVHAELPAVASGAGDAVFKAFSYGVFRHISSSKADTLNI